MHPKERRLLRVELRVLATPFLAARRLVRRSGDEFGYHRGDERLAIALALAPLTLAEAAVVQLLVPQGWLVVHVGLAVLHLYGLLWLLAWGAGPRLYPHRVAGACLHVRSGVLTAATVSVSAVRSVDLRRRRVGNGALVVDGAVALPARRRVDVWLELAEPVTVRRALAAPLETWRLAIAADDPELLAAALRAPRSHSADHRSGALPCLLALPDLAYGSH